MANAIQHYLNKLERLLRVDRKTRRRIRNDLAGEIQARLDAGETPEAVLAGLGSAEALAASFNAEFADHAAPRKSGWRWLFLALAGAMLLPMLTTGYWLLQWSSGETASVGIIGGADGPTAILVATAPLQALSFGPGQYLTVALACLAVFLLLHWPDANGITRLPGPDGPTVLCRSPRWARLLLPAGLAAAALLLWLWLQPGFVAQADPGSPWPLQLLQRFLLQGGVVALAALITAVRRILPCLRNRK